MKARKKPVVIDFIKYNGTNPDKVKSFVGHSLIIQQEHYASDELELFVKTLAGEMKVNNGDYIIKGVNGEFYPCKPDVFEKTYEILE